MKTTAQGLSTAEAGRRLVESGFNEIDATERRGWLRTLAGIAAEPMFMLLIAAAGLYLLLGDLGEGLLLAFFALVTVGLVVLQQRRSEHALDALRALAAPQARVLRDGRLQKLAARELVPGDLVQLEEGERVPADALLLEALQLSADESLLTGESVPVRKRAANEGEGEVAAQALPGGDGGPHVFAGTLVVSGHGLAQVQATGRRTRAGAIGVSLSAITAAPTPLQGQLRRLVAILGIGAIGLSTLLALWYGLSRGDWMQGVLSAIAFAMAMLPEEFPMALAVFLALGAWRLSRIQVLARQPAVIEALGGATVLCVDKTGTLTENRMRLRRLVTSGADVDLAAGGALPQGVHELLEYAMLASHRGGVEPMDRAILARGEQDLAGTAHLHPGWQLEREYPLTPALLAISQAWTAPGQGGRAAATKGAPEAIADLCHLDADATARVVAQVRVLAGQGLRVLGVARARHGGAQAPAHPHDYDFEWLGLAAFEDPLRASVPAAVAQAQGAGIAVVMVTGDHAGTALAIAGQAGIDTRAGALTGEQLAALDDGALREAARRVRVYARVLPEQKLRLVHAFQANGEVVAMTGDGVNDAPALKAAHIGIAMGVRGTDVAREAAGLVLLDEDFGRIVEGVRMGRRIFDNLRKVMSYITAIHVPVAGLALLPVIAGLPPLMLPAHVVLTEMIIDPICSFAFEGAPEDPATMRRPPRRRDQGLIGWPLLWRGALQGLCLLAAALGTYVVALRMGSVPVARGLALVALTVGNLGLVWLNASTGAGWRSVFGGGYAAFWAVATLASAALASAFLVPGLRELLGVALPGAADLLLAGAAAAASVLLAGLLSSWPVLVGTGRLERDQLRAPPAA